MSVELHWPGIFWRMLYRLSYHAAANFTSGRQKNCSVLDIVRKIIWTINWTNPKNSFETKTFFRLGTHTQSVCLRLFTLGQTKGLSSYHSLSHIHTLSLSLSLSISLSLSLSLTISLSHYLTPFLPRFISLSSHSLLSLRFWIFLLCLCWILSLRAREWVRERVSEKGL